MKPTTTTVSEKRGRDGDGDCEEGENEVEGSGEAEWGRGAWEGEEEVGVDKVGGRTSTLTEDELGNSMNERNWALDATENCFTGLTSNDKPNSFSHRRGGEAPFSFFRSPFAPSI